MYHKENAPQGIIVRTELELDKCIADGWVKTPALFDVVVEPVPAPVTETPDAIVKSAMPEVVDVPIVEPEVVADIPEPEPIAEVAEPEPEPEPAPVEESKRALRDVFFPCPVCNREFGSNQAMLAHKKFHTKPGTVKAVKHTKKR